MTNRRQRLDSALPAYVFISPFVLTFAIFGLFPVVTSLGLSFTDWGGVGDVNFIGVSNYLKMWDDESVRVAFRNTLIVWLVVVPILSFGTLMIAWAIEAKVIRFKGFLRTIFFLPLLPSLVVVSIIFLLMMDPTIGLIGQLFRLIGLPPVNILVNEQAAIPLLCLVIIWRSLGFGVIVHIAGLQAFPSQVRDAAQVDGAGAWQYFWHILVPMSKPIIAFVSVLSTISVFNVFEESYVLYGASAGPREAGLLVGTVLYRTGFKYFEFGYTSAIAYAMVLIVVAAALVQLRWGRG